MDTIGDRINYAMRSADMDQPALARHVGISVQAISAMIRNATKQPKPENLFKIARATKFEAEWIITGKGPMTAEEAAKDRVDISHLSPDAKAAFRAVLHSFEQQQKSDSRIGSAGDRKN